MSSRDKILAAVLQNQPGQLPSPALPEFADYFGDPLETFCEVLERIGARAVLVSDFDAIRADIARTFDAGKPVFSTLPGWDDGRSNAAYARPHDLQTTELMILPAEFGVAENGAVWISDQGLPERVLPFIPEHLAVLIPASAIVRTMHEAYARIGMADYGWAAFIAGPSKTADIEQSLVLGAHGPRSMTIYLLS